MLINDITEDIVYTLSRNEYLPTDMSTLPPTNSRISSGLSSILILVIAVVVFVIIAAHKYLKKIFSFLNDKKEKRNVEEIE